MIRALKAGLVFAVGFLFGLIALNNIAESHANFEMLQNVMSMSSVPSHHGRAISSPDVQNLAFGFLLFVESLISLCCLVGGVQMFRWRAGSQTQFDRSKHFGIVGVGLGFIFLIVAFSGIGWEWFLMWRIDDPWAAGFSNVMTRLTLICGLVLIFLCMPESNRQ